MGNLQKNPRAVARTGVAPLSAPVCEVFQNLKTFEDDVVGLLSLDIDDEPDSAGILFPLRVVKALFRWQSWYHHSILV
jgi:hypothetical protein